MPYAIITTDKPDAPPIRAEHREAHLAYLEAHRHLLLAAGAQTADDGSGASGGILIVDTDDRAEAEAFVAADPFTKAGLFSSVRVVRWRKTFFNKERLL